MSGDMRDFNIIIIFVQSKTPNGIHAILTETLEKHAPSYGTVQNYNNRGVFL
jgi:hypothetical protein